MTTQAQIFATEYAKNTAREMLDAVKRNADDAEKVTKIALGVSMPHQIGFILSLAPLHFGSVTQWLESLTLILGSVGIPVAVDYLILICIRTLVARGAATVSKWVAFVAMLFPVGLSATVNFLAPAPTLIRVLFGLVVLLVPISQGVRAMNRPDFAKVEAMEVEVTSQVTQEPQVDPAEQAQRAAAAALAAAEAARLDDERAKRSAAAVKAAATRKANAEAAATAKADAAEARRQAREAKRLAAKADTAELFARIAVETDPTYQDSVAPASAIPVA